MCTGPACLDLLSCTLNDNGEKMDSHEAPRGGDNPSNLDPCLELTRRLNSLSSLVCDLLRANEVLRFALKDAVAGAQRDLGS